MVMAVYNRVRTTSPSSVGSPENVMRLVDDDGAEAVSAAIRKLGSCGGANEVRNVLQEVLREMEGCDRRALASVRAELDAAVPPAAECAPTPWTRENRAFLVSILVHFYRGDRLTMLPREVACGSVLSFCAIRELAALASVSRGSRQLSDSDATWRAPYDRRFGTSKAGVPYDYGASLKESYHQRIRDPTCGDRVEVAWQGRFRLEGLEVYRGLAWWAAEVAEKRDDDLCDDDDYESSESPRGRAVRRHHPPVERGGSSPAAEYTGESASKRYKVHYLNWDSRWDEWVSRDQLRWPVQEGKTCAITPGDDVEVWCSGNTVPGAWLRAVVDRVDDELFCVGNVASSGHIWVSRDRVRLVRHTDVVDHAAYRKSRVPSCLAAPVQKLRDFWKLSARRRNALGCVFAPFRAAA